MDYFKNVELPRKSLKISSRSASSNGQQDSRKVGTKKTRYLIGNGSAPMGLGAINLNLLRIYVYLLLPAKKIEKCWPFPIIHGLKLRAYDISRSSTTMPRPGIRTRNVSSEKRTGTPGKVDLTSMAAIVRGICMAGV
ncbi:hypothetical protein SAMN05444682_112142 [Parapedobacter indicus]|uniref:Uncharacterized protein n=1 Tax=Parapedobacter indicus TaxID=1477437 RepID=A0A1I3TFL4_9SPHI|nr:hypothetical protein CLV26_11239 [Parapedobacter indicus]SFJ69249.1 hypothetical protein SAMN05444682_112142 [Parapedobacter indicus]